MTFRWRWFGALAAGVAGVSITYVTSCYDFAYAPGGDGNRNEGGPSPDGGGGGPDEDVQQPPGDGSSNVDSGPGPCPTPLGRGPKMVQAHGLNPENTFCIDSTEVTQDQYSAFLATNPSTSGQSAVCTWNKSYAPGGPRRPGNHPITAVDWCDAVAFCKWAGKRVCGDVRGGAHNINNLNEAPDADTSQLRLACTNAEDGRDFAYGTTYDSLACNGLDKALDATVPVASQPRCVGGFPGLYDMSGNANEWENSCDSRGGDAGPQEDFCVCRGGSYVQDRDKMKCTGPFVCPRNYIADDVGFRCCK